jgi:hypothetical protein
MTKYIFIYHGGKAPESPEEGKKNHAGMDGLVWRNGRGRG